MFEPRRDVGFRPRFPGRRIVVASNRLPLVMESTEEGWEVEAGSGGLVTALAPVLRSTGGVWVGWPGLTGPLDEAFREKLERVTRDAGYELEPVPLSERERDDYYYGFSNEVLWPLLHDLQTLLRFDPDYWEAYRRVNRRFAAAMARVARVDDYLWVQDYHLMLAAAALRELDVANRIGYFLHTPFPSPDILVKLPWRTEILRGLLQYDLVGFQTVRDRDNFLECVGLFLRDARVEGEGPVVVCTCGGREVRVGAFPISIDFDDFDRLARSDRVSAYMEELEGIAPRGQMMLGVDRLDYTKGILNRLDAYEATLERHPELRGRITFVQLVVPSREHIPEYHELKQQIERRVGEINGRFTRESWVPVHYLYRSLDRPELVAHYRKASIALVTPLKDGMNLVAKEFCASSVDGHGVLILSEFAGAAPQLQEGALLVNPYDTVEVAEAIARAASMTPEERRGRMERMRAVVREWDVYRWVESFALAASSREVPDLPAVPAYVPGGRASLRGAFDEAR
ncbi:MAG TPA: trehalose-6-phosphate synthase [Gemmatimonadota bacterium]|nr:trehalose-6-phosphate synthase [Gemmatimonadota bacterium]